MPSWDVNILGTDISDEVVARASRGWYTAHEIERGMPPARLNHFFQPENNGWRVKDSLRAMCSFERRNLLDPSSARGTFDVIFCRNVAIYFTPEARKDLFLRLAKALTPAGWLFVGGQESLRDLGPQFAPSSTAAPSATGPIFLCNRPVGWSASAIRTGGEPPLSGAIPVVAPPGCG